MHRNAWTIFLITILLGAAYLAWAHGALPDRVASHFDAAGEADGWQSRTGFVVVMAATMAFSAAVFAGIALLIPRARDNLFNLPHRDDWLAPERRAQTVAQLTGELLLIGAATNLFFLALTAMTVQANRVVDGPARLGGAFWWVFALYMGVVLGWTGRVLWRYGRKPAG